MIDTGCELNLIKYGKINPNTWIDRSEILKLTGITAEFVFTLGKMETEFFGIPITFHLVPNEFPIRRNGILGSKFLKDNHIDVLYSQGCLKVQGNRINFEREETIVVPARTKSGFYVRVANPEIETGYVGRLRIQKGIYLGEAVVTNRCGRAYMYIVNSTPNEVEIAIPVVTLEPYQEIDYFNAFVKYEELFDGRKTVCVDGEDAVRVSENNKKACLALVDGEDADYVPENACVALVSGEDAVCVKKVKLSVSQGNRNARSVSNYERKAIINSPQDKRVNVSVRDEKKNVRDINTEEKINDNNTEENTSEKINDNNVEENTSDNNVEENNCEFQEKKNVRDTEENISDNNVEENTKKKNVCDINTEENINDNNTEENTSDNNVEENNCEFQEKKNNCDIEEIDTEENNCEFKRNKNVYDFEEINIERNKSYRRFNPDPGIRKTNGSNREIKENKTTCDFDLNKNKDIRQGNKVNCDFDKNNGDFNYKKISEQNSTVYVINNYQENKRMLDNSEDPEESRKEESIEEGSEADFNDNCCNFDDNEDCINFKINGYCECRGRKKCKMKNNNNSNEDNSHVSGHGSKVNIRGDNTNSNDDANAGDKTSSIVYTQLEDDCGRQVDNKYSLNRKKERVKQIIQLLRHSHMNEEEKESIIEHIKTYHDSYFLPGDKLGCTNVLTHKIRTIDDVPVFTRQYRYPQTLRGEINQQAKELEEQGIIVPSISPYNTAVWIVPKKPDSQGNKKYRLVLDFRPLNEKTIGDAQPLPLITEILEQLGGAIYFSTLDLKSGYHQVEVDPADRHKTAFSTAFGHFEFSRMPFGLKTAPATFQRIMNIVLSGLQGIEVFVYLDDIVIYASSLEEHSLKLERVMKRLKDANLKLQPDKCEFLRREVIYLGHIISAEGVRPDPAKVTAVKNFPRPRTQKNIRQFLGLAGYYRRFIHRFSQIAKPLTNLLKKSMTFEWGRSQQEAFEILRDKLCEEPVLQYPDQSQPFVVTTDASGIAIAGILSQGPIGKDRPVEYTSRVLNDNEQKYSTYEKEALAILHSVSQFRSYLYGRPFKLVTDHKPLVWMQTAKDPTSRLTRWRLKLQEYQFEVIYKAGKTNVNADALSRNPPSLQIEEIGNEKELSEDLKTQILIITRAQAARAKAEEMEAPQPSTSYNAPVATRTRRQSMIPQKEPKEIKEDDDSTEDDEKSDDWALVNANVRDTRKSESKGQLFHWENNDDSGSENFEDLELGDDEEEDDPMIDDEDEPPDLKRNRSGAPRRVVETRDQIYMQKNNYLYFLNEKGEPCDEGSRRMHEKSLLPRFKKLQPSFYILYYIIFFIIITIRIKTNSHNLVRISFARRSNEKLSQEQDWYKWSSQWLHQTVFYAWTHPLNWTPRL
ncbi:uncharacterized protein LOC130670528 [Microplitis mediator]|uniref:uncharacterized protein LOC130670528 n=1 Tax=Microplitis mediator TaxID=375433 RepID=UPI002557B0D8|nr:uncharacterized protein LOC130670528 [Microplitis mediator]